MCILRMWFWISDTVNWCMVAWCTQNLRRNGSSLTWHQPCAKPNSFVTTSVDIQKTGCVKLSLIQSGIRLESRRRDDSAAAATVKCSGLASSRGAQQAFIWINKETWSDVDPDIVFMGALSNALQLSWCTKRSCDNRFDWLNLASVKTLAEH